MVDENKLCVFTGYGDLDEAAVADHLSHIIQFPTIADRDLEAMDIGPFLGLRGYLEKTYPLVHQNCEREIIAGASMLYRWPGSGKGGKKPILLMAHQDVVPVTPGTEEDWQHPAFDGVIADGHVWGRGAIDMKNMLCAEFEAMEYLMQRGFTPDRDVYLALGHDEEVGGSGAVATAQHLLEQGVEIDFIMDEGGKPAHGEDFGASDVLVATISVFEKGYCDLQLISRSPGGHSNRPGKTTALGELAKAIVALEASPMPAELPEPFVRFYSLMGPYLDDPRMRELCTDLPNRMEEFIALLEETPQGNAMVRTTTAVTQAWGSPVNNVLPQKAVAGVNFRLNPRDTVVSLLEHVRKAIHNDAIELRVVEAREASRVSPTDTPAYALIEEVMHEFYPELIVASNGLLGGTDSRKYECVCNNIYRFYPFFDTSKYRASLHGTNERISVSDLVRGTRIMIRIIEKACQ